MADETLVNQILLNLGEEAPENGWDEIRVAADLDAGKTANRIALDWWEARMGQLSGLVDTSESGSTRSLSQMWTHAQQMANYYQKKVLDETPIVNARTPLRSYPMRRV